MVAGSVARHKTHIYEYEYERVPFLCTIGWKSVHIHKIYIHWNKVIHLSMNDLSAVCKWLFEVFWIG